MPARRLVALSAALALGCPALTACDRGAGGTGHDAAEAATALARGLAAGDLSDVPLAGATPTEARTAYEAVVAGMGDVEPRVAADEAWSRGSGPPPP
jgi:predicted small secreted protein